MILSTNKGGQITFSVIRTVEACTSQMSPLKIISYFHALPKVHLGDDVFLANKPNYYMYTRNLTVDLVMYTISYLYK